MPRICVIEDERVIANAICARLRSEGFDVDVAYDGPSGLALCDRVRPDLVVLDVMLPGIDGLEVCRRVQRHRAVTVIMVTARGQEADMLTGLGVGADDYMTKPFSPRELVARVRALLRRAERAPVPAEPAPPVDDLVRAGAVELDRAARRVRVEGEEVRLTPTEFSLLSTLVTRPGAVFSRDQLLDGAEPRTVDSHVRGLRRKIGSARVRTVHGVGYSFEAG